MAFATNFDKEMKRALEKSVPTFTWKTGWHPKGQPWRVDLTGLKGNRPRVFIEAELKKDDPAANVIKIWRWARDQKNTKPILFVQGFSKLFWQTKVRVRERAEFVGARMAEAGLRIDYRPTTIMTLNNRGTRIPFRPRSHAKEGGGRMRLAAKTFAKEVARMVHSA